MITSQDIIKKIRSERIKEIFEKAIGIATLHNVLTFKKGNYFHLKLLHSLEESLSFFKIEELRMSVGLKESYFHFDILLAFHLVELVQEQGEERCKRTELGKMSINAVRDLESLIGKDSAIKLYEVHLGPNSIRFFLRICHQQKEVDFTEEEVKFSPHDIDKLSFFPPRSIGGIKAIDKLNDAALLNYDDDGFIYLSPLRGCSFYRYLLVLNEIIKRGKNDNK